MGVYMTTSLHSFYDLPASHNVCHLYEHIVIGQFSDMLKSSGLHRAFFGRLNGQTIDSTVFFDVGAFSAGGAVLFSEYLARSKDFSSLDIKRAIAHIEAETRTDIKITNMSGLKEQLVAIDGVIIGGKDVAAAQGVTHTEFMSECDNPDSFCEVVFLLNVFDLSPEDKKAFLCLRLPLLDIVRDIATVDRAAYPAGVSPIAVHESQNGLGMGYRFVARKTVNVATLEQEVKSGLSDFVAAEYKDQLADYRRSFAQDDWANTQPLHIYYDTNMQVTVAECADLATPECLGEILNKVVVQVVPCEGELEDIEWL